MLKVCNLGKNYKKNGRMIRAADGISFTLAAGDFAVIHGPSGSGKSTLLLMLGGMLPPDEGSVFYGPDDIYRLSAGRRNHYRKHVAGFVFQRFFLLPYLSVYDNIRMPLSLQGGHDAGAEAVAAWARRLRIEERLNHMPGELSVGEQQRAALARSLVGGKKIILADEPTGNLDAANIEIVAQCLQEESRRGRIIVLVTHNKSLLGLGNKCLPMENGRITEE